MIVLPTVTVFVCLVVMASIPCAVYQVGHLHGTLRREHHSRMRALSMSRHGIFEEKHSTYAVVVVAWFCCVNIHAVTSLCAVLNRKGVIYI